MNLKNTRISINGKTAKQLQNSFISSFRQWLNDPYIGEILFFAGYILCLGRAVWVTTMFPYPDSIDKLPILLGLLLIVLKILLYDHYKMDFFIKAVIAVLCSGAVFVSSRYLNVCLWLFIVLGSKDISFQKLLRIYLLVTGTIVLLAFLSSLIGVIENLQYQTANRGIRNSFGIVFVTDFAAHIFYLTVAYFCLKGPDIRWYHCIGAAVIAYLVYHYCNARVDTVSILLTGILYGIHILLEHTRYAFPRWKQFWNKTWQGLGPFLMPTFAGFSIMVTAFYKEENRLLAWINEISSNRLDLGLRGIKDYGITLFGQSIEMIGGGGTTEQTSEYFFVYCSYMHILLRYGFVFTVMLIGIYVVCCYKHRNNLYFLFAISLVALNCIIAHHIIELAYNPFSFILLACHDECKNRYLFIAPREQKEQLLWNPVREYRKC